MFVCACSCLRHVHATGAMGWCEASCWKNLWLVGARGGHSQPMLQVLRLSYSSQSFSCCAHLSAADCSVAGVMKSVSSWFRYIMIGTTLMSAYHPFSHHHGPVPEPYVVKLPPLATCPINYRACQQLWGLHA